MEYSDEHVGNFSSDVTAVTMCAKTPEPFELTAPTSYLTMRQLRERGWTPSIVSNLLGRPDGIDYNVTRPKRPRRLWRCDRIFAAEQTDLFAERRRVARERSATMTLLLLRASQGALDAARSATIDLSAVPLDYALEVRRIAERNGLTSFVDETTGLVVGWDCLAVEYLLQATEPVETVVDDYFGRPGVRRARSIIRERLLDAISERFPELSNECARRKICD